MKKLLLFIMAATPTLAFAQGRNIKGIASSITTFLSKLVMPMLFSAALVLFIWGIVVMIKNGENPEERKRGQSRMIWGIIALFAMIAYLGLTAVLTNTVFETGPVLPQLFNAN